MSDPRPAHPADQPPYPDQLQLPAAGQTFTPLPELATAEELEEYDHAAALATLATAGMCMLAFQHETHRDLWRMKQLAEEAGGELGAKLMELHDRMDNSLAFLHGPMAASETGRSGSGLVARRYAPGAVIKRVEKDLFFFVSGRGVQVTFDAGKDILLPPASFAEWSVMFQNAFVNASNAIARRRREWDTLEERDGPGLVHVEFEANEGAPPTILIHDNGCGADVDKASDYFRPFYRAAGGTEAGGRFGGFGLGLSIIQLVAGRHGMRAQFIEPAEGWATTLRIGPAPDRPHGASLAGAANYDDVDLIKLREYGSIPDVVRMADAGLRMVEGRNLREMGLSQVELRGAARSLRGPAAKAARASQRERFDQVTAGDAAREAAQQAGD
jgi:hypothetical protein